MFLFIIICRQVISFFASLAKVQWLFCSSVLVSISKPVCQQQTVNKNDEDTTMSYLKLANELRDCRVQRDLYSKQM
jgi:hypothetical protein